MNLFGYDQDSWLFYTILIILLLLLLLILTLLIVLFRHFLNHRQQQLLLVNSKQDISTAQQTQNNDLENQEENGIQHRHTNTSFIPTTHTLHNPSSVIVAIPAYLCKNGKEIKRIEKIAKGGFATIYKGIYRQPSKDDPDKFLAIKVFHKQDNGSESNENAFLQEVAIMSGFSNLEYFVKLKGYIPEEQSILMKWYDFGSLYSLIHKKNHVIIENEYWLTSVVLLILLDVTKGIWHLHQRHIIHRDIKPQNILIEQEYGQLRARITDFGLSCFYKDDYKKVRALPSDLVMGVSASYCPPEIFQCPQGQENLILSEGNDIYSLGITIYETLSRQKPWHADPTHRIMERITRGEIPKWNKQMSGFVEEMMTIVRECCLYEPRERMKAEELVKRLEQSSFMKQQQIYLFD